MSRRHAAALAAGTLAIVAASVPSAAATTGAPAAVEKASVFTCTLRWSSAPARAGSGAGSFVRINGSCAEGPFLAVLVEVPRNRVAPGVRPQVDGASRCTRPTARSVRCTMRSATSHVGIRIGLREKRAQRPKITFYDRAGRVLQWVSGGGANPPLGASPPLPTGSGFPQTPLQAEGTFTNGSGGCPVATAFRANFLWTVTGTALRIDQFGTTHTVFGTITQAGANQWSWQASTPTGNERYTNGVITRNAAGTGFTATANYAFTTANGCTETYSVTFVL